MPAVLQTAPFGRSGNPPLAAAVPRDRCGARKDRKVEPVPGPGLPPACPSPIPGPPAVPVTVTGYRRPRGTPAIGGHRWPSGHSGGRCPNGSRDHPRREVPPARVLGCGVPGQFWCPPRSSDRTSPVTLRVNIIAECSQPVRVERTIESSGSPTGETYRRRIEVQHGQDCPAQGLRLRGQRHRAGGGGRRRHEVVVMRCDSDSRSHSPPAVRSH